MLFELSHYLDSCASLTCRQECDMLKQHRWPKCQTWSGFLDTLQTYLGIMLIERTFIACSLSGKNTLSIEHINHLFKAFGQAHRVLIRRNMVWSGHGINSKSWHMFPNSHVSNIVSWKLCTNREHFHIFPYIVYTKNNIQAFRDDS